MIFLLFFSLFYNYSFEVDEVYSKILSDKFFRGIVADNLIEETEFVLEVGCSRDTYSEMKGCIIGWIEKNPKKASELFSKKVKTKGEFKINSVIYEYYINPAFKEIIDKMQDAAKKTMSMEDIRGLSSFLFDANVSYDNIKDLSTDSQEVKSNSKHIFSDYFRINTEALKNEVLNINNVFYNLSNYKVKDLGDIIKKTDDYHNSFNNYFSTIKNSKVLDKNNVDKMFKKLEEMKKMLILKTLVIRLRVAEINELNNPVFNKISKDIIDLSKSELSFKEFLELSLKIWNEIDYISKFFDFMKKNKEISSMLSLNYSCFLDYLFSLVDKYVAKNSYKIFQENFFELRNYFLNISYDESGLKDYIDNYQKSVSLVELNLKNSKKNRMIQYLIWDGFLPYDIYWSDNKRFFGLKIIHEKLFNYPYGKSVRGWNY